MRMICKYFIVIALWAVPMSLYCPALAAENGTPLGQKLNPRITINEKDTGYRGIWHGLGTTPGEYRYKYSGGLGTYCAKHRPFAVYCPQVNKTFFCYGGAPHDNNEKLIHMVSFFDHATKTVPRPTILLDKRTTDPHDNPVISVDDSGYIWIFSTSHGTGRPSYIHKSKKPYNIDEFELIPATMSSDEGRVPFNNFSYFQPWFVSGKGFCAFMTLYGNPAGRTSFYITSEDGIKWSSPLRLAAIHHGHYQVSAATPKKAATAFDYHPNKEGINGRTNLYYLETLDFGRTWQNAAGSPVSLPVTDVHSPAKVHDFESEGLDVYVKDIDFDEQNRPVILFMTSLGWQCGPKNGPRIWMLAQWTGTEWKIIPAFASENNYDAGSLYLESPDAWRIIGPTVTGPQAYNPGGEMMMWLSVNRGESWNRVRQLTCNSPRNHNFARRPVNANPDFYALWADGDGRKSSISSLYFCDKSGHVYQLPRQMNSDFEKPCLLTIQ